MDPEDRHVTRLDLYWIVAILLVSLAVRCLVLWAVSDVETYFPKYPILAERLKDNGFITPEVFAYCPLYVYFLAFLLTLTGGAISPVFIVQIAFGSIGTVLMYYIARRLTDRKTAVIAALFFAFSRTVVLYEVNLLADSLATFLELWLLVALLLAFERSTLKHWALSGLFLGLSTILRPTAALALVGIVPAIWFLEGKRPKARRLGFVGMLVGVTVITTLPITIQNARVGKDFVPVLTTGGYVFYASNNHASSAIRYAPPPLLPAVANADTHEGEDPVQFWDDALSARIANSGSSRDLKPSEVSRFYLRRALDPVGRYPGYFFKLVLRKALGIVSAYEVHDTLEASVKKNHLASFPLIPYGPIFGLGMIGLFASHRYRRTLVPIYVLAATQVITMLVFYVVPRFRLPLEAILCLFAAFAITWWIESPRHRSTRFFLSLALFGLISYVPRTEVMKQVERDQGIQSALAEGAQHASKSEFGEAIDAVNRVIDLVDNPASPLLVDAHWQLADFYRRIGDEHSAHREAEKAQPLPVLEQIQLLSKKIQEIGASPRLLTLIADKYKKAGKWAEAKDYFSGALSLAPENPTIRYQLAEAQLATGESPDGLANLELALKDGLDFTRFGLGAHYHLWKYYGDHDPAEAEQHRDAFRRLSWIFQYLKPTPAEIEAMKEMSLTNPFGAP